MIRDYKNSDIDAIMQLWLQTNISAHSFISSDYWQNNFHLVKEMMPNARIYVYESDADIKGFIGLMGDHIAGVFVSNISQSNGIGRQLLNFAKSKTYKLNLSVYKKNNRAINFYHREQFAIVNEQIDANTNEIELIMKWDKNID